MPVNIEVKARAVDWDGQSAAARALCDACEELVQEDAFFRTPKGRLKLRVEGGRPAYLIYYEREDLSGPKSSRYLTAPVPDPASTRTLLAAAFGEGRVVRKRRRLYQVGRTRVHFDEVEGLGRFIELEVCLDPGQSRKEGEAVAEDLMRRLKIARTDLLEGAYADMS